MKLDPRKFRGLSDTQMAAEIQLYVHALGIDSVETKQFGIEPELSIEDRKFLIENVPTNGYEKIKDWFDDNFFGIDFNREITCIKCRNVTDVNIPIESAFFF